MDLLLLFPLTNSQKELLNKLYIYQEDIGVIYPFHSGRNSNGYGTILGVLRFEFNFNDLQTLVDLGLLSQESRDSYRFTRQGYQAISVKLTDSAKEALYKMMTYKEQGGVYPFVLARNAKGNWVELFSEELEFRFVDIERLIDFGLLHRSQSSYKITESGYRAIHSNFDEFDSASYNLKNIRTLLSKGFTDKELRRLCYDNPKFRPVYDQLAQETGKADIIDRVIEYANQYMLIEMLLNLAKEHNPDRYEKHKPYKSIDPT